MWIVHKDKINLLNAATGTGAGPAGSGYDLGLPCHIFTFNKTISGGFAALVVNYEGSMDGTNWYQIGTDNTTTAAPTFVVDKPCRYIRANVATFTGGTSVTVDAMPARMS